MKCSPCRRDVVAQKGEKDDENTFWSSGRGIGCGCGARCRTTSASVARSAGTSTTPTTQMMIGPDGVARPYLVQAGQNAYGQPFAWPGVRMVALHDDGPGCGRAVGYRRVPAVSRGAAAVCDRASCHRSRPSSAGPRLSARSSEVQPRRSWQKSALLIGGSAGAGAGLGAADGRQEGRPCRRSDRRRRGGYLRPGETALKWPRAFGFGLRASRLKPEVRSLKPFNVLPHRDKSQQKLSRRHAAASRAARSRSHGRAR